MGTNIYIQSDFIEPYDKYLHDPMGTIRWKRLSRGGRNRREIFELLKQYVGQTQQYRVHVAPNGTVQELYDRYEEREVNGVWNGSWDHTGICSSFGDLVIYKDEMAHRGEGKEIIHADEAIEEHSERHIEDLIEPRRQHGRHAIAGTRVDAQAAPEPPQCAQPGQILFSDS